MHFALPWLLRETRSRGHLARCFLCFSMFMLWVVHGAASPPQRASLVGTVEDSTGAVLPEARLVLRRAAVNFAQVAAADPSGNFRFAGLLPGEYQLTASATGFSTRTVSFTIAAVQEQTLTITLRPGAFTEEVTVVATEIVGPPEAAQRIPGSVEVVDEHTLEISHAFNFSETLRKVTGLNVRDEEGFGLRPNIGLRGLNPTRSSKMLLLEDGVPLAYAPYGDNASYYHPPVERFSRIEVLKGSGQILYGPVTVGGVVNYLTPDPPRTTSGSVTLTGGNRAYFNGGINVGGTWHGIGWLLDYMRKQGDGARENLHSGLNDFNLKLSSNFLTAHTLTFKANYYGEDSNVTYSGLRLDEYLANPRANPFRNDFFFGDRYGVSLQHTYALNAHALLSTTLYGSLFARDWWRQSSNSSQRPNDVSDPACGGMQNLNTTCGNEGRLRTYYTWGIEPRVRVQHHLLGLTSETDFGVRAHFEVQDREQRNGPLPTSRSGLLVEHNERRTQAYSAFLQNHFVLGRWTLTPGVRVERIYFQRTNRLANAGAGVSGDTDLTQVVPGIGVSYAPNNSLTFFAGVHRGFAPPRVEDVISNTGGTVELDPELSWNYEIGARTYPLRGVRLDLTYFRMDYENQIIPASLAGGLGAALTNGGSTLHQGLEFSTRLDTGTLRGSPHNLYFVVAHTWLPSARFTGTRFSNVPGFSAVSISGNRLPYAPKHLLNGRVGYSHPSGIETFVEAVYVADQFADDLNTIAPSPDGQRGLIPGSTTWNATANYHVESWHTTFFVTVKNLADSTFIVDRSRGILPSSPRLVQSGVKFRF